MKQPKRTVTVKSFPPFVLSVQHTSRRLLSTKQHFYVLPVDTGLFVALQ